MKKIYVQPVAKRILFNFADTVMAAQTGCQWSGGFTDGYTYCKETNSPMESNTRIFCGWISAGE